MNTQELQNILRRVQSQDLKPLKATAQLQEVIDAPITVIANQLTYLGRGDATLKEVTERLESQLRPEYDPFQL